MNRTYTFCGIILLTLTCGISLTGYAQNQQSVFSSLKDPANIIQLKHFVAEKSAEANASTNHLPKEFKVFFAAAQEGNWNVVSNLFQNLGRRNGQWASPNEPEWNLRGTPWEAAKEVWGTFYYFALGDEKYSADYANNIIASIPPGSIYFGGTDPGRFLITGTQKSQINGNPFFTLTQNALVDDSYLDYLRSIYGGKIYIPTAEDSQKAFADYISDATRRSDSHQLKPGESVYKDSTGKVQISGQVAVMEINGLLAKTIFDKNPKPNFYIEESFPLDWMYPHLEPHGLIFKLDRQSMAKLPDELVQRDHDYWAKQIVPMIGAWLNDDTSVAHIATFVERNYLNKDLSEFKGDPHFIHSPDTQKMFSKLRSSIAELYAWRVNHPTDKVDKMKMARAADFAFRQAWVLCPYSPEVIYRYINFLLSQKRLPDAILIAGTAAKFPSTPGNDAVQIQALVKQLKQFQKAR